MAYLKYFIGFKQGQAFLDCVTCLEGEEPQKPANFVKWYEAGDLDKRPIVMVDALTRAESPGVHIAFAPRLMSPALITLLKEKYGMD